MAGPAPAGPLLLRPGLWISDRFRTSSRLAILCAVLVLPGLVSTWAFDAVVSAQVRFTTTEVEGLAVLVPTLEAMAGAARTGTADVQAIGSAVRAHPGLHLGAAYSTLQGALATSTGAVATTEALHAFATEVANSSNLILDPDLDSYYVMDALTARLPEALVASAQGAGAQEDRTPSALAVQSAALTSAADALTSDVQVARQATADRPGLVPLDALTAVAQAGRTASAALDAPATGSSAASTTPVAVAASAAVGPAAGVLRSLLQTRARHHSERRYLGLAITALGDLLAVAFAAATWWRSRHDVRLTVDAVTAIAEGDLDEHELPTGRDELGDIARALTTARHTLVDQRDQLHRAQREREDQLRTGFQHQQDAERQTRDRAQALIDDAATTVLAELASLMDQVDAVRRTAGELEERVATAESVTRSVVDEAAAANRGSLALGESLQEVGGMAAMISGIAGQTKLLALNATIEAARAGSVGAGFTVVADEVKTLAGSTAQSTERITATLAVLHSDAAQVGSAITSVGAGIASLDDATGALAGLATEQRSVVANLQSVLTTTIGRVQQLTTLSDQLERRRTDRRATSGTASLEIDGGTVTAVLADLSETGMRCVLATPAVVRPGTLVRGSLLVGGRTVLVDGTVVRGTVEGAAPELGVEFHHLPADQRKVLKQLLDA